MITLPVSIAAIDDENFLSQPRSASAPVTAAATMKPTMYPPVAPLKTSQPCF